LDPNPKYLFWAMTFNEGTKIAIKDLPGSAVITYKKEP
jgi:hypothetical protein